jgi:hypothetical protein
MESTTAAADFVIGNDGVDVGMMAATNTATVVDKFPGTPRAASVVSFIFLAAFGVD